MYVLLLFKKTWFLGVICQYHWPYKGVIYQYYWPYRHFSTEISFYSSTNKTDHHSIAEILLKVALNTIALTRCFYKYNLGMKSSVNVMSVKIHFSYINIYRFVIYGSTSDNCFDSIPRMHIILVDRECNCGIGNKLFCIFIS